MAPTDISGHRFGRLVALHRNGIKGTRTAWAVRCDCGIEKTVALQDLVRGKAQSCGCLQSEYLKSDKHADFCRSISHAKPLKHGKSGSPIHAVWKAMIQRCTNPKAHDFRFYGALGVSVCDRWRDFRNFYADMGEPNGLTLDRENPSGNYEPDNCRWATWETQRSNKRAA